MTGGIGFPLTRISKHQRNEMIAIAPVLEHVRHLQSLGMTKLMIARAAGLCGRSVTGLHTRRHVTSTAASAILGVTPRPMRHQALVLSFGAQRRIKALACEGHSHLAISSSMGEFKSVVGRICVVQRISWDTHQAVDSCFARLSGTHGGSARAKARAEREGFLPALAWDDIDNFYECPKKTVVYKANQRDQKLDRLERVAALDGLSAAEVAVRLNLDERVVVRDRAELRRAAA